MNKHSNMDEITKKKIANKLRGRKKQARTKWLISQAMRDRPKTDQHRQAISEAMMKLWKNKNKNKNKKITKL